MSKSSEFLILLQLGVNLPGKSPCMCVHVSVHLVYQNTVDSHYLDFTYLE